MKSKIVFKSIKYLAIYYLSAKMICFGIPKFLFMQFRVLHWQSYVPLVEVSKAQHMWSFFGRSPNYNLFIGLVEYLIGTLIVFNKTRLIALLLALGLCVNILILNIEFDIHFAISHIMLDLILTLLLLLDYRKDLYGFFIKIGGKLYSPVLVPKYRLSIFPPLSFITVLTISYSAYTLNIKSKYTVDEHIVGAYEIKSIKANETIIDLSNGILAKDPMMLVEYNNQFLLSIEDTLYMGRYILKQDSVGIYLDSPTKFGMKSMMGSLQENALIGRTHDNTSIEIMIERIDSGKNYLNTLYW